VIDILSSTLKFPLTGSNRFNGEEDTSHPIGTRAGIVSVVITDSMIN
jgi:hypothetical protein